MHSTETQQEIVNSEAVVAVSGVVARGTVSDLARSLEPSSAPQKVNASWSSSSMDTPSKILPNPKDTDYRHSSLSKACCHPQQAIDNSIDVICNIENCQKAELNQLLPIIDPICNREEQPPWKYGLLVRRLARRKPLKNKHRYHVTQAPIDLKIKLRVRAHTAAHAGKDEEAAKAFVTARGTGIGRQSHCCHRPGLIDFRGPNLPDLQAGRDGDEESKGPWCSQRGQKGAALPNTDLTPIHNAATTINLIPDTQSPTKLSRRPKNWP